MMSSWISDVPEYKRASYSTPQVTLDSLLGHAPVTAEDLDRILGSDGLSVADIMRCSCT